MDTTTEVPITDRILRTMRGRRRDHLWAPVDIAAKTGGITTHQAATRLRVMAKDGRVKRVARGVYRLPPVQEDEA